MLHPVFRLAASQPQLLAEHAAGYAGLLAEELVSNACAYSRKDSTIEIGLSTAGKFTVRDGGRGMTPDQLAQLGAFRQFDRQRFEQQGLGLGCELVQRLVARQQAPS